MGKHFFDYDDGDFAYTISEHGNRLKRAFDDARVIIWLGTWTVAIFTFISSWNNGNENG